MLLIYASQLAMDGECEAVATFRVSRGQSTTAKVKYTFKLQFPWGATDGLCMGATDGPCLSLLAFCLRRHRRALSVLAGLLLIACLLLLACLMRVRGITLGGRASTGTSGPITLDCQ